MKKVVKTRKVQQQQAREARTTRKKMSIRPKIEQKNLCTLGILTWFFFFNLRHCPRNWIHLFVFTWEKKRAVIFRVPEYVTSKNGFRMTIRKTTKIECFCDSATFETKWFWLHFWSSACVVHDNLWFWGAVKVLIIILIFRQNENNFFYFQKLKDVNWIRKMNKAI